MSRRSVETAESPAADPTPGFELLDNFEGPFDLLLSLIADAPDITEVSLSQVTDDFIAFVKVGGKAWDLEQTTSFLLVASTLDLKAARLLPQGDVEDEEDLALLEARDLLFARLLQYRAFKQVAAVLDNRLAGESLRHARSVGLEERFASLLPEVLIGIARAVRGARREGDGAQAGDRGVAAAHPRQQGQRSGAGALVVDALRRSGT